MFNQVLVNLDKLFTPFTFLGLGISFIAGVLASLSPCILPLIPITLGIVGAVSASTKLRGFLISLSFVLGLSVIYTTLGIVSAFFGILLGTLFINPITYIVLAILFFLFSAISLGLISINLP
ncbi:MAG: cytochrome c biogenesis protein CcdA, partial [Candidatus Susulua stagnicola]|nr:cytochrome c biogenesis protein CcdA [Candidatus Susulua stagnicola]